MVQNDIIIFRFFYDVTLRKPIDIIKIIKSVIVILYQWVKYTSIMKIYFKCFQRLKKTFY